MSRQAVPIASPRSERRIFYGWWIVAIGCIQDAVKGGLFNTGFSLYFLPVLNELHLSRASTSLPFSLAKLEAALAGPLVGYLIDRFDIRVMMVLGTLSAGLGFVLLAMTHSYVTFLLVFVGLLGMGFQAGFNQASLAAVNNWFRLKRSLAMSILQTGQAIGGVVFFPLVAWAVLTLGWRTAALLSGGLVFLLTPLVLLVRRSPESMGLLPDGEQQPAASRHSSGRARRLEGEPAELTTQAALRTSSFWFLAAFHGLRNIPYGGVTVHLVPLLVWKGLDESSAAVFVGLMSLCTIVIRPLTGWLGDSCSKQWIGATGVLLGSAGLCVLLWGRGSWWHMTLFVILFSFADAINSVTWALVGDFFGRQHFASIRGWIGMIQSFATMPAAVFTGWVYDQTHSYTAALLPFIALYVLGAVVLLRARPPK
ncbi:MAG: MFS transporter [Candidatus Tectimicrobiota bacterium]